MRFMKFVSSFLFVILCCTSYAHEQCALQGQGSVSAKGTLESAKVYINPENITFSGKDMYVCVNQNWIQTNALFSDIHGIYFYDNYSGWNCPRCGKYNTDKWQCSKCGYRPHDEIMENN